jgi:iron complex outermembrane receptor protein
MRSECEAGRGSSALTLAALAGAIFYLIGTNPCRANDAEGPSDVHTSAPAAEKPQSDSLEEIVVTARRRSENVQSVPESVEVFGNQELEDAHVTKMDDLGNMVSNLNIATRGDNTPDVVLRGVGSFGVVQGVGFYANDVQLFDGQTVRPEDLERVEVLKGPQGTLYGGSNIGGAIKYVTKLPTDSFEAQASVEAGNYDTQTYSGVISGPISPGVLDARVSFYDTKTGGYEYDTTLGRYVDGGTEEGGRVTLLGKFDTTTVTLYLNVNSNNTGAGANIYYRPGIPEDPNSTTAYSHDITAGTQPEYRQNLYSAVLNIQQQINSSVTLTSISSAFHSTATQVADADKGPLPLLSQYAEFYRSDYSQELRLGNSSALHLGGGTVDWLLGVVGQVDNPEALVNDVSFIGSDPTNPQQTADPANFSPFVQDTVQRHQEYALYGNATYQLGPWGFQAGIRADYNWSSLADPLWNIRGTQHNLLAMPMFSASYHFRPDVMTYLTISRGFEPGDLVEGIDSTGHPDVLPYHPETATNYELGLKSTWLELFRFNAAVFYTQYDNRLFQTNVFEHNVWVGVTENVGDSHNYGAEFDVTARIATELHVNAALGFTKAVWGNIPYADPDLGYATGTFVPTNLDGRSAPMVPAYQGSLTLDWTHALSNNWVFAARPSIAFFGREYWDVTDHYHQPAYHLVDMSAHLDDGPHWKLSANIANAFNQGYLTEYASAGEIGAPLNVGRIGRPRLWSVAVTYRW